MCNCIDIANRQLAATGHTLCVVQRMRPGNRKVDRIPLLRAMRLDPLHRGKSPTVLATHCPFCGEKFGGEG